MIKKVLPSSSLIKLLLILSAAIQPSATEWSLQSTTTLSLTNNESDTFETGAGTRLAAFGGYSTGSITGRVEFGISFDTDSSEPSFQIQEAYLAWQPRDGISLLAGRRYRSTGLMDFLSPAEFLSPADLVGFASGTSSSLRMAADVVEATIYGSSWKLVGAFLPLSPGFPSLNPDSIWFPKNQFPKSLEFPIMGTLFLDQIIINYPDNSIFAPSPAFQLHGSYANKGTELIAGLYLGPDPESLYRFRLKLAADNPNLAYDIIIYADRKPILAGFFSAAWTLESIRLYGEASISPNRHYSANLETDSLIFDFDGYTLWRSAWAVDAGIGIAAFVQALNLDLILETRHLFPNPAANIRKPSFSSIATMYAQRRWLDGKLDTSLLGAITPELDTNGNLTGESGWALSFTMLWRPAMELEFKLGLPLFGGDEATDLGRYAMIRQGSLTAIIRH